MKKNKNIPVILVCVIFAVVFLAILLIFMQKDSSEEEALLSDIKVEQIPIEEIEEMSADEPTETPEKEEEPKPTEIPEPAETPEPTETPKPTETSEPAETPKPTETPEPVKEPEQEKLPKVEVQEAAQPITVLIEEVESARISSKEIQIIFTDNYDDTVETYLLMRRNVLTGGGWENVGSLPSDKNATGDQNIFSDKLGESSPQQYEYRVDVKLPEGQTNTAQEGKAILASNVMICIDPGHFAGRNQVTGEQTYGYAEGDFTIEVAKELKRILKETYGIDSYMTRSGGSITLGGYTDGNLDSGHISLRGTYTAEKDADLFMSIHTNANEENANGYPTCMQPISINKPLVIANGLACSSDTMMRVANGIGVNLAATNYQLGISTVKDFATVEKNAVSEWTKAANDKTDAAGTVFRRTGSSGGEYYGVLKGAAKVNKPGIIVEHGFHTVPEMRKEAMEGNLKTLWAQADAYGIAYGFGFVSNIHRP